MLFIFIIRPVIDLAWNHILFMNMNLAGLTAVFIIILSIIHFLIHPHIIINKTVFAGVLYVIHIGIVALLNFTALVDLNYTLRLLSEIMYLVIVAPHISIKKLNKCILLFTIMTLIPIFITYFQTIGIIPYTYFDYINGIQICRGSGGYHQPSVLTRFCSVGLLYTFYMLEDMQLSQKLKIFLYLYIALNVLAIILSYHRTGYLLVFAEIVLWLFLKNQKNLPKFICNALIGIISILVGFTLIYKLGILSINLSTFSSMLSISNIFTFSDGKIEFGLRGRGKVIEILKQGFALNPWCYTFFGNGVNTNPVTGIAIPTADMEVIRVLWNGGIIGMGIWLSHFISLKRSIFKYKNIETIESLYRLGTCLFWIFIIWGLTIEATNSPNLMYHVYLICGIFCYKSPFHNRILKNNE